MFAGIGLFGALTANLASFIVGSDNRVPVNVDQQLLEEVRSLRSQVARLEETVTVMVRRMDGVTRVVGGSHKVS